MSGGLGSVLQPIADVVGALGAPFTGGASLALPFAVSGIEDVSSGNFSNIGEQLVGDTLSAVPFAGGFAGAGAGLAGDAAAELGPAFLGGDAGAAAGSLGGSLGADAAGGLGGALSGAGGGISDILGGLSSDGGFAGAVGGDVAPGGFAGSVPSISSIGPSGGFGESLPQALPVAGGAGSASGAADPFGVGGLSSDGGFAGAVGPDVAPGGGAGAVPVASSAPALTAPGGGPGGIAFGEQPAELASFGEPTAPGTPGGTPANAAPSTTDQAMIDAGLQAGTTSSGDTPAVMAGNPGIAGSSGGGGISSFFSGAKDFLKNNKDLISLGSGALGVGNAIYKDNIAQQGLDLLAQQAQAVQMRASQFQDGYNSLLQQALPLIQAGAAGQVTPGQAANLMATANAMKQQISAKYAADNLSGSTSEQQDLNNVDLIIAGLQGSLATATINQGAQLASAATGEGGLNGQLAGSIGSLAQYNVQQDDELSSALSGFAKAAAA